MDMEEATLENLRDFFEISSKHIEHACLVAAKTGTCTKIQK